MRTLLSGTVILLCACSSLQTGDPADEVRLSVTPATSAPGDSVTLTLDNRSREQVGYNLCASGLQRQSAAAWDAVALDIVCTMELRTLDAGQQATFRTALPTTLESGTYRYTTNIEAMETGGRFAIISESFRVDR